MPDIGLDVKTSSLPVFVFPTFAAEPPPHPVVTAAVAAKKAI